MPYIRHERGLKIRRFTLAFSYFERTMLKRFMLAASNINGFECNACNLNLERGDFFLIIGGELVFDLNFVFVFGRHIGVRLRGCFNYECLIYNNNLIFLNALFVRYAFVYG